MEMTALPRYQLATLPHNHGLVLLCGSRTGTGVVVVTRPGSTGALGVHALRHGFCTELVRSNVGVETVRVLAGHEDLRTTQRYLHAERSDPVQAMETFVSVRSAASVTSRSPLCRDRGRCADRDGESTTQRKTLAVSLS